MKKSKIIIPALGVLALSTAASITGTVAWFTANRTATIETGNFAVVNTKDNLNYQLTAGVGTFIGADNKSVNVGVAPASITNWENAAARTTAVAHDAVTPLVVGTVYHQLSGEGAGYYYVLTAQAGDNDAVLAGPFDNSGTDMMYKLTDASFDHTATTANLIVPDATGTEIDSAKSPSIVSSINESTAGIIREKSKEGIVFSAFTWDIEFSMTFNPSATQNVGLYLDTDSSAVTKVDLLTEDTAKAFKIAFVPLTVSNSKNEADTVSVAYTKVWGSGRENAGTMFIDQDNAAYTKNDRYFVWDETAGEFGEPQVNKPGSGADQGSIAEEAGLDGSTYDDGDFVKVTYATEDAAKLSSDELDAFEVAYGSTFTTELKRGGSLSASTTVTSADALSSKDTNEDLEIPANGTDGKDDVGANTTGFGLGVFHALPGNTVSLKYRCVAFYEGTDESIETAADTIFNTVKASLTFGVSNLTD